MALFPTDIKITASNFSSIDSVLSETTQNGQHNAIKYGAQRFAFTVNVPTLSSDEWRSLMSFKMQQGGALTPFTIRHPLFNTAQGVATGTPLIKGASQSGNSLITDGWTISTTDILKKGSLILIAGSNKVYFVTDDSNSDGTGEATLSIYPELQFTPADNAAITIANVPLTVYAPNGVPDFNFSPPDFGKTSFNVIEALS